MTKIISAIFCFALLFSPSAEAHTQVIKECHTVRQYVPAKEVLQLSGPYRGKWVIIPAHYRNKRICNNVATHRHHTVTLRTRPVRRHHHHHRVRFGVRINL